MSMRPLYRPRHTFFYKTGIKQATCRSWCIMQYLTPSPIPINKPGERNYNAPLCGAWILFNVNKLTLPGAHLAGNPHKRLIGLRLLHPTEVGRAWQILIFGTSINYFLKYMSHHAIFDITKNLQDFQGA